MVGCHANTPFMPAPSPHEDSIATDVLVIGAGPAGLAVAGSLAQMGVRPEVIERCAEVGSSWRAHYERLHLHTVKQHSALPHLPFPSSYPKYVPRQQVVDYLEAYARHFGIVPRFGLQAARIARDGGRWALTCHGGLRFTARHVVLATGANDLPNLPAFAGQGDFRGEVIHSSAYRDAEPFHQQRVLVVGMGNTGAEIALDLAERGVQVAISARSPVNVVYRDVLGRPTQLTSIALSRLPTRFGDALARLLQQCTVGDLSRFGIQPAAVSPLRQLREEGRTPVIDIGTLAKIKSGAIAVRPGILEFTQEGVQFVDGRSDSFDTVILATGFHAGVGKLFPGLEVPLDETGLPTTVVGDRDLKGLYFVGFDIRQAGGLLRTISLQARQVALSITAALQRA